MSSLVPFPARNGGNSDEPHRGCCASCNWGRASVGDGKSFDEDEDEGIFRCKRVRLGLESIRLKICFNHSDEEPSTNKLEQTRKSSVM